MISFGLRLGLRVTGLQYGLADKFDEKGPLLNAKVGKRVQEVETVASVAV